MQQRVSQWLETSFLSVEHTKSILDSVGRTKRNNKERKCRRWLISVHSPLVRVGADHLDQIGTVHGHFLTLSVVELFNIA